MESYGIGASVLRKEDDRFLRGRGQYVADFRFAGMREAAFVRSPVAHARLKRVIVPEQFRNAVYTAKDLTGVKPIVSAPTLKGFKSSSEPILAADKLRFVGEIVAMCVAASRAEAEDVAAAVTLEFEELPVVTDALAACEVGASRVHDEWADNLFVEFRHEGPIEEAARTATIKVTRRVRTARHCMVPIEGRGVIAYRDARLRQLTLITSTQFPHSVQTGLSECLGIEHGQIRVISPDVGGGFGYKGLLCREEVALAWLALQVDYPVRWLEDRREHLTANANCREHHYQIDAYATADGKLIGIDCIAHVDAGAYSCYPISSALEAAQIASLLPGPYVLSAYRCRSAAVATNKCPILPYRGVARTGVCLAIETIMDAIAGEAKLEPYEVRLRNMVRPELMPFDNIVGKHFDSGNHPECLRRAVAAIGLETVRERQRLPQKDGRLIGVGVCFFVEQGAMGTSVLASWGRPMVPGYEQANMKLTPDGEIQIHIGTHSHGQGHETTYAQVAHEILGVDFDKIRVVQGDTLYTPYSTSTWGSRSMVYGGGAVAAASRLLAERAAHIGAWLMQADAAEARVADGKVMAGNSSVTLREVARAWYLRPQTLPPQIDTGGLEVTAGYRAARDSGTFTYAAHAAVVAVDPSTGAIEILDYVVVEDGGTLVNPMIVDGQIRGGTAQGIGTCLYEATPFDLRGQPLATTLQDYLLPSATDVPEIKVLHMSTPSPYTAFGIKGLGEGGAVGPPAAIVSAVNDALRPFQVEIHDLPLTPQRIVAAIESAEQKPAPA
ncbi:MAG TPA: xanthine dehydrogenase family protein molybdopterin-binding subunit [Xanthobacteraceae bacterium]